MPLTGTAGSVNGPVELCRALEGNTVLSDLTAACKRRVDLVLRRGGLTVLDQ